MQERLGFGPASLTIVFSSASESARSHAFRRQVETALSGVRDAGLGGLTGIRTAWTTGDASFYSRDGTATFAVLEFDGTSEEVQAHIAALRRALEPTPLTTHLTGDPAVYAELEQRSPRTCVRRRATRSRWPSSCSCSSSERWPPPPCR